MRCWPGSATPHFQGSQPGEPPWSGASQPFWGVGKRTMSSAFFIAFYLHILFSALYQYNQSQSWSEQSPPVRAHHRKVPSSTKRTSTVFQKCPCSSAAGAWPSLPSVQPLAAAELTPELLFCCCRETLEVKCSAESKHCCFGCPPGFYFTGEGLLVVMGHSL